VQQASVKKSGFLSGLLIAALLFATAPALSDAEFSAHPMRFEHLTLDNGLSQSNVLSILQDARGQMWFGTENGLNSYNGYEFRTYYRERGKLRTIDAEGTVDEVYARLLAAL